MRTKFKTKNKRMFFSFQGSKLKEFITKGCKGSNTWKKRKYITDPGLHRKLPEIPGLKTESGRVFWESIIYMYV